MFLSRPLLYDRRIGKSTSSRSRPFPSNYERSQSEAEWESPPIKNYDPPKDLGISSADRTDGGCH